MMRKPLPLPVLALAVSLAAAFLWSCDRLPGSAPSVSTAPAPAESGDRMAPQFTLSDISGNKVESSRFQGRPTVINFFATWCPPCREEIPGFVDVYNKYRDRGFELVGIVLDTDTRVNLPVFLAQNHIEYRILLGDVATARAFGGVNSIPTTFFVGRDGRIRNVHVGYIDRDAFEREVLKLM